MQESFNPFAKNPNETPIEKKSKGGGLKTKALATLLAAGLSLFSNNAEGADIPEKSPNGNSKNSTEQTDKQSQKTNEEIQKISAAITKLEFTKKGYEEVVKDHEKEFAAKALIYQKYCEALKGIDTKEEKFLQKLPEDIKKAVTAYLEDFVKKNGEDALKKFSEQGMVNEIVNPSHPVTGIGINIVGTHSNPSTIGSTIKMFGDQNARLNFTGTGGVIEQLAAISAREWFYLHEQQKIQLQATKLYAQLKKAQETPTPNNSQTASTE